MVDRINIDIVSVWNAIMSQLRSSLSLTEDCCFWWTDDQNDPPPAASNLFITVAPDGGEFDAGLFDGGGTSQLTVKTGVLVTVHTTQRLDTPGRDLQFLTNTSAESTGVGKMLTSVLKALSGFDPTFGVGSAPAMREFIMPSGFRRPQRISKDKIGSITIHFDISFDWDLS